MLNKRHIFLFYLKDIKPFFLCIQNRDYSKPFYLIFFIYLAASSFLSQSKKTIFNFFISLKKNHFFSHLNNLIRLTIILACSKDDWKKRTKCFYPLYDNYHYRYFNLIRNFKNIFSRIIAHKIYRSQGQKYAIINVEITFVCMK